MIKVASIFSGIGGFELGMKHPSIEFVFSSEIDKYARQIYLKNFGIEPYEDITKIDATSIPDHTILCAGFPCQAFSIAGKRQGFNDTRGTLFFEIMRIAKTKRPTILFLENVKGLLSHNEGRTFETILNSMDELGYDAEWQVFNSKNHGVPQNRERVFIIGHLRGSGTRSIFPIVETSSNTTIVEGESMWGVIYNIRGIVGSLTCKHRRSDGGHIYHINNKYRIPTPIECERLQGFPDNWTEGISNTQRYKCLGNAITINVVEFINRHLLKMLNETQYNKVK